MLIPIVTKEENLNMNHSFQALVVNKVEDNFDVKIKEMNLNDLHDGEVTVKVAYSSVNYKDGLAANLNGGIVRNYPFIPGIDLAGTVIYSSDSRFK